MPYLDLAGNEDPVEGVWKVRPEQGEAALALTYANWQHSLLTTREREAARHRVAQINECRTCQSWRVEGFEEVGCDEAFYKGIDAAWRDNPGLSTRERLAIELAERFSLDWTNIGPDFMAQLRESFSDEEIVDLMICIGQYVAQGRLIHILDLDVVCAVAPAALATAR